MKPLVFAVVRFQVEVTDQERRLIAYAERGLTDAAICERMKITVAQLKELVAGLQLPAGFNLVQATRDELIAWSFPV